MTSTDTPTADNGVDVPFLLGARTALSDAPAGAQFQWRAETEWVRGTHSGLGDVFDRKGRVRHDGGVVTASPGTYVIGLPFLRRRKSTLIDAAADAADIVAHLAAHLANAR